MNLNKNLFLTLFFALALSVVSIGCDSNDEEDPIDFLGDWQQVEEDPEADAFVRITESQVIVAAVATALPDLAVCIVIDVDDINVENGRITGTDNDGDPISSSVSLSGNTLTIDGDTYQRTTNFPSCTTTI